MFTNRNTRASVGGLVAPSRRTNMELTTPQSPWVPGEAVGHATRTAPCGVGRKQSGIRFREEARRIGREIGSANPMVSTDTLNGMCLTAYVAWLSSLAVPDKHRKVNIEFAQVAALEAQISLKTTSNSAVNPNTTNFRDDGNGHSQVKRYSRIDEVCLPHLQSIPNARSNSNKWELRKVVVWDHSNSLKPVDLISRAEKSGVDLNPWLKVRRVNGSETRERCNRLEVFCAKSSDRTQVQEDLIKLLSGVVESECVRLGRTFGFRKMLRQKHEMELEPSIVDDNMYDILPVDEVPVGDTDTPSPKCAIPSEKKTSDLKVWTLNCGGITSKAVEVTELVKSHKPHIIVVTETWLKGNATFSLSGYKGYFANRQTQCARGEGGVAIFVKSHLVTRVCKESAYKDLLWVKVHLPRGKPLVVGGFYGPQETESKEVVTECYRILSEELQGYLEHDVVLMGDMNAKVGNTDPCVGPFGPAVKSRNGKLLLDVLTKHGMHVLNGRLEGEMHTTRHGKGNRPTMLDLIVTNKVALCKRGAQVLHKDEFGSDHLVVEANMSIAKLPRNRKIVHKRWNRERLLQMVNDQKKEDTETPSPTAFETACSQKLKEWIAKAETLLPSLSAHSDESRESIEMMWATWVAQTNEAGREAVGEKIISSKSRSFFDDEAREAVRIRRELFESAVAKPSSHAWKVYHAKRKEVSRIISAKKRSDWEKFNLEINTSRKTNPKRFWSLLKRLDKSKSRRAQVELNKENGDPCLSNAEVLEEFTQHFATVGLNTPGAVFDREWQKEVEESNIRVGSSSESELNHEMMSPITREEVARTLKELANGKATGRDGIPSEFLKHGGECMSSSLALLFEACRVAEYTPQDWHKTNIVPIYKKGDKHARANYRGVSLLSCVYKLYARILKQRLALCLEPQIAEEQAGFSPGKGCDDNLCIMTEVMERKIANHKPLYVALVDMRAAFDTVWRAGLWHKLSNLNVPNKMIRILQEIYSHGQFSVVANGEQGADATAATAGVLQGDVLSPDLFKAFINDLPDFMRSAGCTGVEISELKRVILLMFADDILLWGESQEELQLQLNTLHDYCCKWQLEVSVPKTKILLSPQAKLSTPLLYNGAEVEVVHSHPYLGVLFQGDAKWESMLERSVEKAGKRQAALSSLLTNKRLPMMVRYGIWCTVVRPILEWGLEVYSPPDTMVLERVQRSALRMIMGVQTHAPMVVLESDLGACSIQHRMDMRKSALLGKMQLAREGSLLSVVNSNLDGKCSRTKRCLNGDIKRVLDTVLKPADLETINPEVDEHSAKSPLQEWKGKVKAKLFERDISLRVKAVKGLSSLVDLQRFSDLSNTAAHPYTMSTNGVAASLWAKIRSNTLPLGRLLAKVQRGASDKCKCCEGQQRETLWHFLSDCPALHDVRTSWVSEIVQESPQCQLTVADIPRLILGGVESLALLPLSLADSVTAVETLLVRLWRTRNAMHHGDPSNSLSRDQNVNGGVRVSTANASSPLLSQSDNSDVDRPSQQTRKTLRVIHKTHAQLKHHPIAKQPYTNMVLRSRVNRLELMEPCSKA